MMVHHDNDDEPLPFVHLAAATANVVRWLQLNQQKEERSRSGEDKKRALDKAEFMKAGLDRLSKFEDRYSRDRSRR